MKGKAPAGFGQVVGPWGWDAVPPLNTFFQISNQNGKDGHSGEKGRLKPSPNACKKALPPVAEKIVVHSGVQTRASDNGRDVHGPR